MNMPRLDGPVTYIDERGTHHAAIVIQTSKDGSVGLIFSKAGVVNTKFSVPARVVLVEDEQKKEEEERKKEEKLTKDQRKVISRPARARRQAHWIL